MIAAALGWQASAWVSLPVEPQHVAALVVFSIGEEFGYAWFLERGGGSLAIALALHAGAHLDNVNRLPARDLGVRVFTLIVVAVAALLAARSLRASNIAQRSV